MRTILIILALIAPSPAAESQWYKCKAKAFGKAKSGKVCHYTVSEAIPVASVKLCHGGDYVYDSSCHPTCSATHDSCVY